MEAKMSMDTTGVMGKAIGGRTARPCDVCGRERARWFCAADEAYLCERCDASVHSANAVARRHERARIGAPKTESRGLEMKSNGFLFFGAGTRKRARTSRPHPQSVKTKVKAETEAAQPPDVAVPEHESGRLPGEDFADYEYEEELLPQVPIFVPALAEELSALRTPDQEAAKIYKENSVANCGVAVPESDLHHFLNSETDLFALDMDMDMDVESIIGQGLGEEGLGILGFQGNDFGRVVKVEGDRSDDLPSNNKAAADEDCAAKVKVEAPEPQFEPEGDQSWDTIEINLDYQEDEEEQEAPTTTAGCESHEVEDKEGFKIELELCSILRTSPEKKISLQLNYEDVLNAWSDRGSLWASSDDCISDGGGGGGNGYEVGLVPDLGLSGGQVGPMPGMINGGGDQESSRHRGREARVLRYREKRRTRLFSKKIRYEVRKLNAEKRPRMKGRFVKRTSGKSSD